MIVTITAVSVLLFFYIIAQIIYCVITNTVGSISFTSKNGDAKITLNNITIQAFSLDGDELSSRSQYYNMRCMQGIDWNAYVINIVYLSYDRGQVSLGKNFHKVCYSLPNNNP